MQVSNNHVVTLHYRLSLDDGSVLEDSFQGDPLVYVQGSKSMLPGLESGIEGKQAGDECEIRIDPADAYGEIAPDTEKTVPRSAFPAELDLQPGMPFKAQGPEGGTIQVWIKSANDSEVTVTGNHPLAGERLTFKVKVLDVREATEEDAAPADT